MKRKNKLFYGWWIVIAITALSFSSAANPFNIVLKSLMTEFNSGRGLVSLGPSLSAIAGGISGLIISKLLLKHKPKVFMLVGSIGGVICLLLLSQVGSLWQFYILYFLYGAFMAGAGALTMFTVLGKWFTKRWGTAIGFTMAGGAVGAMVVTPVVGLISEYLGWRATYLFAGFLTLLMNIPLILLVIKENPQDMGLLPDGDKPDDVAKTTIIKSTGSNEAKLSLTDYLKKPALWLIGFAFCLISVGDQAVSAHQVSFITDMGISATLAASALGFTLGISGVTRLGSGLLADKLSSRYVLIFFMLIEIAGMVLLMKANTISDVWLFVIVYGLGTGAATTLLPCVIRDVFGAAAFAIIFAVLDIFFKVGSMTGTPLAGFIFDATGSYHLVFIIIIAFYMLAIACIYLAFGLRPGPLRRRLDK